MQSVDVRLGFETFLEEGGGWWQGRILMITMLVK